MTTFSKEADTTIEASFVMSWNIFRAKCPYSDGEFIKKNIAEVVTVLVPNNTKLQRLISQTQVSRHTKERRISQNSAYVEVKMQNDLNNFLASVFVHYVSSNITLKEEMLELVALNETVRGVDIKTTLYRSLTNADVPLNKLVSIATVGAPEMVKIM